jgi:hypothetical protein
MEFAKKADGRHIILVLCALLSPLVQYIIASCTERSHACCLANWIAGLLLATSTGLLCEDASHALILGKDVVPIMVVAFVVTTILTLPLHICVRMCKYVMTRVACGTLLHYTQSIQAASIVGVASFTLGSRFNGKKSNYKAKSTDDDRSASSTVLSDLVSLATGTKIAPYKATDQSNSPPSSYSLFQSMKQDNLQTADGDSGSGAHREIALPDEVMQEYKTQLPSM